MRRFEYASPANIDEVITLLGTGRNGDAARRPLDGVQPLAGGTDLLTLMKADVARPESIVNIKGASGLDGGIAETPTGVTLGALTTLTEIERSRLIATRFTALAEAVAVAATPQLRNMATIGGNLLQRPRCWYFRNALVHCWLKGGDECQAREGQNQLHALFGESTCVAVHPSDPAPALVALDAEVTLRGPRGERTIAAGELFALPEDERRIETVLGSEELILSLHLPAPSEGVRSTYLKAMDRKIWAFALAGVAAVVRVSDGKIDHARLVLGGVAPIPWRVTDAERALLGQTPEEALFASAAEAALAGARPLDHNAYKIPLLKALIRRALRAVTA